MLAILAFAAISMQNTTPWPPENGSAYDLYVQAAKLLDTQEWRDIASRKPPTVPVGTDQLDLCRLEAKRADGILELLKKGNAMPVSDPFGQETLATLHPDYAYFVRITRIAYDAAYADAADGRLDEAYSWLSETERFVNRLPVGSLIGALVRMRMLTIVTQAAFLLLPRLTATQLDDQISIARQIADHPLDMNRIAQDDQEGYRVGVRIFVEHPDRLGLRDWPDMSNLFSKFDALSHVTAEEAKIMLPLMKRVPLADQDDATSAIKDLDAYSKSLSPADQIVYRRMVTALRPLFSTKRLDPDAFAKSLDASGLTYAEKLVEACCDGVMKDESRAFAQPERMWALPWKPAQEGDGNAQFIALADGRLGSKWFPADMYALQIAGVIRSLMELGDEDNWPRTVRQSIQLQREKARLLVVHAELRKYALTHRKLPESLQPIGNPIDPLSGRPYAYKKLDSATYSLAAVGVPGVARYDMDSKVSR